MAARATQHGILHDGPLDGRSITVTEVGAAPDTSWIVTHHRHGPRDEVTTLVVSGADALAAWLAAAGAHVVWCAAAPRRVPTWIGRAA